MARHRRRRAGGMRRAAGPFAGAMKAGRTMGWEAIAHDITFDQLSTVMTNVAFTNGPNTIRFRVLLPHNLTRGAVTMVRVRGMIAHGFSDLNLGGSAADQGNELMALPMNIQLVSVSNDAIDVSSVLDPGNPLDFESNRVLWRRTYQANLEAGGTAALIDGVRRRQARGETNEIDIKSQRRWDLSQWALILVKSYNTVQSFDHRISLDLRALFKAPDGV